MDKFTSDWNKTVPNFQITSEQLRNPTGAFFIEAVLTILDYIDFPSEKILQSKPIEDAYVREEFQVLENICAATNAVLLSTHPQYNPLSVFDLMSPSSGTVQTCLGFLHNLSIFINDRKNDLAEKDEEAEKINRDIEIMTSEIDRFKIERNDKLEMMGLMEKNAEKYEKEIASLSKPVKAKEAEIRELKTQIDIIQAERETIQENIIRKEKGQITLEEDLRKLKMSILNETKQEELMELKNSTVERDRNRKEKIDEMNKYVWKKESEIKSLQALNVNFSECQKLIEDLEELGRKIKAIRNSIPISNADEKELKSITVKIETLESELSKNQALVQKLEHEENTLNSEIAGERASIEKVNSDLKDVRNAYSKSVESLNSLQTEIDVFKTKFDRLTAVCEDLHMHYDETIKKHVNDTTRIIKDLGYVYK